MHDASLVAELQQLALADEQQRLHDGAKALAMPSPPQPEPNVESAADIPASPRLALMHQQVLSTLIDRMNQYVQRHSLIELAEQSGVSKSSICSIKNASELNPSFRIVTALCREVGLTLSVSN